MHAGTYLLKLEIDDVIFHEWGQAYPDMLKEARAMYRSMFHRVRWRITPPPPLLDIGVSWLPLPKNRIFP